MAGIAGMITEGKNSDFIRIFMVATVEVRIFLALLSPSYEKGLVVGLTIFVVGSDDVIHENLSRQDSNNPLGEPSYDHFGLIEMCILHCQLRIDHI